jgi:hypothetical protein
MRRMIGFAALLLSLLSLSGCGESYSWLQKTTIEVDTPQGPVSASNVVKIGWSKNDSLGAANGPDWVYGPRGEALVLELPDKRYLFALLMQDEYAGNIAGQVLFKQDGRVWGADKFKAITAHKGVIEVPLVKAPTLVTFADVNDAKTVQLVYPENLAVMFGPGFALKAIKIEITEEAVTIGLLEKTLSWVADENPIFVDWRNYPFDHPLRKLNKRSFITGTN